MDTRVTYTKALLEPIVKRSLSIAQVLKELGKRPLGGSYKTIHKYILHFGIDTSHFKGQGWNKGYTKENNTIVKTHSNLRRKHSPDTAFINGIHIKGSTLHKLFDEIGIIKECTECHITETYNNKPITLHIDHINGNNYDNRLENLRYLCPNCHSQTDTYGNKNKHRYDNELYVIWEPSLPAKTLNNCPICDKETKNKYCSTECQHIGQRKCKLEATEIFEIYNKNNKNLSATGRELGISAEAIKNRLQVAKLI